MTRAAGRPSIPVSREKLLDAATSVFSASGYQAASLREMAERVGIRKASLLSRFGSKEALYLEALGCILGDLGALLAEARLGEGAFLDRLDRLGELLTRYFGSHPMAARLLFREVMDGGPFSTGPGAAVIEATLAGVVAFLQGGMAEGAIAEVDADHLAISIIGLHLTWFATPALAEARTGQSVSRASSIERRVRAVQMQVRRLCGAGQARL